MRFPYWVIPGLSLLAATALARPMDEVIEPRQLTSGSIVRSIVWDVEVAETARVQCEKSINHILKHMDISGDTHPDKAAQQTIKDLINHMIEVFQETTWAIQGDLDDAIPRIGHREAIAIKVATTKLWHLSSDFSHSIGAAQGAYHNYGANFVHDEAPRVFDAIRDILKPIEKFTAEANEDKAWPGSLDVARLSVKKSGDMMAGVKRAFDGIIEKPDHVPGWTTVGDDQDDPDDLAA